MRCFIPNRTPFILASSQPIFFYIIYMSTSVANLGEQARSAGVTAKREKKGKKITLYRFVRQVELKISPTKTEVFPVSISAPLPIKIGQLHLATTQRFSIAISDEDTYDQNDQTLYPN